jgi:hypothetical protein
MDTIIPNHDARHEPTAIVNMRTELSIADPGTLRLGDALISAIFPPLCQPDHILTDPGTLRLGDAEVSAQLPCL